MTSISNGESGLSVRTKLNASLAVTDAFTVSGANVGIGAGAGDFGNTGKFAVQTASSTNGIVATFANSGSTGAAIQFFQNGISTATIGMPAGVAALTFAPDGGTERMRIDASGNVMVNTTAAIGKFVVAGTSSVLDAASAGYQMYMYSTNGVSYINAYQAGSQAIAFSTTLSGTDGERMRIDASGNVGIGTSAPNAASIVDAQSTTKGVRFPNMTTTQKAAIANVAGNVVFDTTLGKLCVNNGSGWQTITSV